MKIPSPFPAIGLTMMILIIFMITQLPQPITTPAPATEIVQVRNIIDGDTIDLIDGRRVRYIGIDAPETAHGEKSAECYGEAAKTANSGLVMGKSVKLTGDVSDTDAYGRILRYVYVDDIFINEILVSAGYAKASSFAPDLKYQEQFFAAENTARDNNLGLWSQCKSAK